MPQYRSSTSVPAKAGICDLENLVAFGHKQLWRPPVANRLSVTSRILWPPATRNYWRPPAAKVRLLLTTWSEMVTIPVGTMQ